MNETKNTIGSPEMCLAHSYVVKASIMKEPNRYAVELVCILTTLIERAGGEMPDITYQELIDLCPAMRNAMDGDTGADKSEILDQAFTKAWELLRTQTLLEEKFEGIRLPTEIPTVLTLDEKLESAGSPETHPDPAAKPIDSQELALLQTLFAMMLRNRESTASIRLKDFLAMVDAGPVDQKTDVGSALGLLSRLGRLYYQPEGRPGELPARTFYSIVALSRFKEDEDGGTINLYSWYAKTLLEADPDVDPDKYLPIPEDRITDQTRTA